MKKDLQIKKKIYLNNLLLEFKNNKEILDQLYIYIKNDPPIDSLWKSVLVIVDSLSTMTWNDLVKSGVLEILDEKDIETLLKANNGLASLRLRIHKIEAIWIRMPE